MMQRIRTQPNGAQNPDLNSAQPSVMPLKPEKRRKHGGEMLEASFLAPTVNQSAERGDEILIGLEAHVAVLGRRSCQPFLMFGNGWQAAVATHLDFWLGF